MSLSTKHGESESQSQHKFTTFIVITEQPTMLAEPLQLQPNMQPPSQAAREARAPRVGNVSSAVSHIYSVTCYVILRAETSHCLFPGARRIGISTITQYYNIYVIIEQHITLAAPLICASFSRACSLLLRRQERQEPRQRVTFGSPAWLPPHLLLTMSYYFKRKNV